MWRKGKIAYLVHAVSKQGVVVDDEKIKVIVAWPLPTSVKELRGFLGLTGYHRKFIAGYARIASTLTGQLMKDGFQWSNEATEAFSTLKSAITNTLILVMPNISKVFIVETDASKVFIVET